LRDLLSAIELAAPVCRADTIDEYRELVILAQAWERGSLAAGLAMDALGRAEGCAEASAAASLTGPRRTIV
jgi:hypothetical protein